MKTTEAFLQSWAESRTRFSNQLSHISQADLRKKLGDSPNSAGFLIRHIADVELLFAKNIFGDRALKVSAKTVMAGKDTGEWTQLEELLDYQLYAFESLKSIVEKQKDEDWEMKVSTKEFGAKTKAEAMGRISSHTAYHAGQLAIVLKYGN
ncbi:DinB family protein [Catalinimonas alkaloidigena]|uniref:DinB family protein n=1 Tax=Catalinimonas alkaloidigena TaxID=1075417 RepID=UPI00240726C9|nr:DinB family protein [Catalinimonas alkaloidigena]